MNWYYVEAGRQAGPVTEAEFSNLVSIGRIQPQTLVWSEGMANWQPYGVMKSGTAAATNDPLPGAGPSLAGGGVDTGAEVVCAECGKLFSRDNVIQYGTTWICAACKPIFIQKFKEGAALPVAYGELQYASFWIRFAAKFLDNLITTVIGLPVGLVLGFGIQASSFRAVMVQQGLGMLIGFVIGATYTGLFVGKYGATPGKMALQLKVVMPNGERVSYGRAFGRYFAELLSGCPTLLIGYIIAAFDGQRRSLHDHICHTRVIRK